MTESISLADDVDLDAEWNRVAGGGNSFHLNTAIWCELRRQRQQTDELKNQLENVKQELDQVKGKLSKYE